MTRVNASGQEVPAEPVAWCPGGQRVTKPGPPACHVGQEVSTAERGQSAATKRVQRAAAGVPRACPEGDLDAEAEVSSSRLGEWYNPKTVINSEGRGFSTKMRKSRRIECTDVDNEGRRRRGTKSDLVEAAEGEQLTLPQSESQSCKGGAEAERRESSTEPGREAIIPLWNRTTGAPCVTFSLAGGGRGHEGTAAGRADANTEENLRATVDAILTDALGEQEAREKAGRAETAKAATRRLQEVIRRGVVNQQETVAAAGEATAGATGAELLEEQEKLHPTPELIAAGMREANRRAMERGELEDCIHIRHNGMHAVGWRRVTAHISAEHVIRHKQQQRQGSDQDKS